MKTIEDKISSILLSAASGKTLTGVVRCDADDGVVGYTGSLEYVSPAKSQIQIHEILKNSESTFSDLLFELHEASTQVPLGPWYCCSIEINQSKTAKFTYFWEGTPFTSVSELARSIRGEIPNFVFKQRFDRALVQELSDDDLNNSLLFYVPHRAQTGAHISEELLQIYCTLEWQGDVNNGAMDQYFARDLEPMTRIPRSQLYERTYNGLLRIGHKGAAALYAESISLYSHFHERVEAARIKMGLSAIPRQDESDIMDRYFDLQQDINQYRALYIREHIKHLEQN
jgi:hypothetical protein